MICMNERKKFVQTKMQTISVIFSIFKEYMICCNKNNSMAVLNYLLSSLIYNILACLTENINFGSFILL